MHTFEQPYDTTACSGFVLDKLKNLIEKAFILNEVEIENNLIEIRKSDITTPIPFFIHPVKITVDNKDYYAIDVRSTGSYKADGWKVRNPYEYGFIKGYGKVTQFWNRSSANKDLLKSVSHLPAALFGRWMSENISRRFGLDPQSQLLISIISIYFYLGQFSINEKPEGTELNRIVSIIAKTVHTTAENILPILDGMNYIRDIDELCKAFKEKTGSMRLEDLNRGILYTILGSTWFGNNNKEIIAVAIEYPPLWVLICLFAYTDRSYKNTGIGKITTRDKRQDVEAFVKSYSYLFVE